MSAAPIATLGIEKLAGLLRDRKLSPVELAQATLLRIEKQNPTLNAYITVLADDARREAREAERDIIAGRYRGVLHGIPVSIKDLFYTRGVRTTAGSKLYADFVPEYDATVVERLRSAGAIIVGKTNLHELAYGITNNNPHFGPVRNPWRTSQIPGGSSGGSGVAVAASLCAASLGSDTGGSIRIPASFCGVVGLKPTFGRVSRWGVFPLAWSLDHVGPLARSVWDTAAVYTAIAGPDSRDEQCSASAVGDCMRPLRAGLRDVTIGVPDEYFFDHLSLDVEKAMKVALKTLEERGAKIEQVHLPRMKDATALARVVLLAEASAFHQKNLRRRKEEIGEDVRALLQQGQFVLATDYLNAQRARRKLCADLAAVFQKVRALVMPATPVTAAGIGEMTINVDGAAEDTRLASTRLVRAWNLTGLPVLSVPCGFDHRGLPIGMQIVGKAFDEATILRIGYAYEQAAEWVHRHPADAG